MSVVPKVRITFLAAFAALALAAPAQAATPFNIGTGTDADVVIDAAGNGHFAWVEGATVRYCRVPRGATACSVAKTLAMPAAAISSVTNQGPARVVNPVTNRIAIVFEASGGAEQGIYVWNSTDNGATFVPAAGTNPRKIGTTHLGLGQFGGRLVDGPNGSAPFVSNAVQSGNDPIYQRMSLNGPAATVEARFGPEGFTPAQDSPVGLAGATPVIVYNNDNTIFLRRYTGATGSNTPDTNENDKTKWSARTTIAGATGDLPRLATGSAGLRLGWRSTTKKLMTMSWNGSGFSSPVQVSAANSDIDSPNFFAKPGIARYTATWRDLGYGDEIDLRYSTSTNGTTWSPSAPIARGNTANNGFTQQKAAAAADGQGFAVWNGVGGAVTVVPLEAIAEQTPPGGSGTPPGGTPPGQTPPAGGGSGGGLPPGTPTVAPQAVVSQVTVGNEVIQFFGPKSCVVPGQKVKLRVTSKRKKKLAGSRGRSKIKVATFFVDKTKKKDKKKAFAKSFTTENFPPGSTHKVGAGLQLKQLSGKKKSYKKNLKGSFPMCTT